MGSLKTDTAMWKAAIENVEETCSVLSRSKQALCIFEDTFARNHPLSKAASNRVLQAFKRGEPLCCAGGRMVLRGLKLNEFWITKIDEWAYDTIGCSGEYAPGGHLYEVDLAKLKEYLVEKCGGV